MSAQLVTELTILMLAIFLGFEVISKVPTLLHTPLMSGTNAIHGIVIVGAIIVAGTPHPGWFMKMLSLPRDRARERERRRRLRRHRPDARDVQEAPRAERTLVSQNTANLLYLIPMACFILALRFLSSPRHARLGNQVGAAGMAVAIVVTLLREDVVTGWWIMAVGGAIGAAIGAVGARKVKMTAMPQMVALFNGVGGGAAALVSLVEFHTVWAIAGNVGVERGISTVLSALIGSISFAGSMVAFAKLQELLSGQPITFPGQQIVNGLIFVARGRARHLVDGGSQLLGARRR